MMIWCLSTSKTFNTALLLMMEGVSSPLRLRLEVWFLPLIMIGPTPRRSSYMWTLNFAFNFQILYYSSFFQLELRIPKYKEALPPP